MTDPARSIEPQALPNSTLRLLLIRHAESEMNTTPHLIGGRSLETPLTKLGKAQAKALGEYLTTAEVTGCPLYGMKYKLEPDLFACSTAERALQTAEPLKCWFGTSWPKLEPHEALLEYSAGQWEHRPRTLYEDPEVKAQMLQGGRYFCPPGGESQEIAGKRMFNFIHKRFPVQDPHNRTAVLISHGVAIKALLWTQLFPLGGSGSVHLVSCIHNTGVTILTRTGGQWSIETLNNCTHLDLLKGDPPKE